MTPVRYVIDASIGIKVVVEEAGSDDAQLLLSRATDDPDGRIFVPDLFYPECANVLWKLVRRLKIAREEAERGLEKLRAMVVTEVRSKDVLAAALRPPYATGSPRMTPPM